MANLNSIDDHSAEITLLVVTADARPLHIHHETAEEREECQAYKKREQEIVAKELKAARYVIASRCGLSGRLPFELSASTPLAVGPAAATYSPSLTQVKRTSSS